MRRPFFFYLILIRAIRVQLLLFLIRAHPRKSAVSPLGFPITAISRDVGDHRGPQIGPFLPVWGGIPAITTPPPSPSIRIQKDLDGSTPGIPPSTPSSDQ
jgi:hypothetical protein